MILPHITNCITNWTQTCKSKPIESIYKQAVKVIIVLFKPSVIF